MADWNFANSLDAQRDQPQGGGAERPVNGRVRESNRDDAPLKPDGKSYTAREIGECVQATRILLDRATERLRHVEVRLLRAEEHFERAGYHLDEADICLSRARERTLQLQCEQVERRIQREEELARRDC